MEHPYTNKVTKVKAKVYASFSSFSARRVYAYAMRRTTCGALVSFCGTGVGKQSTGGRKTDRSAAQLVVSASLAPLATSATAAASRESKQNAEALLRVSVSVR